MMTQLCCLLIFPKPWPNLSHIWIVDSAYSINFNAFCSDFMSFEPSSGSSCVGGMGVDVMESGKVK
jgi:uncharacterized membrane protein